MVLGGLPRGGHPALGLQPLQRGIQRTELNLERLMGGAANGFGDAVSVQGSGQQRAEHEHVERALQQVHMEEFYMKMIYMSTDLTRLRATLERHADGASCDSDPGGCVSGDSDSLGLWIWRGIGGRAAAGAPHAGGGGRSGGCAGLGQRGAP